MANINVPNIKKKQIECKWWPPNLSRNFNVFYWFASSYILMLCSLQRLLKTPIFVKGETLLALCTQYFHMQAKQTAAAAAAVLLFSLLYAPFFSFQRSSYLNWQAHITNAAVRLCLLSPSAAHTGVLCMMCHRTQQLHIATADKYIIIHMAYFFQ